MIKFDQKAWLKPSIYIDMNIKLRQKAKNNFEKDFFDLISNANFGKSLENVKEHKNVKLAPIEIRRNYLVWESNYHAQKFFTENILAIEMRKTQILKNKPVCLGLSILDLIKTVMYELWCDYVKPKYGENANLCYMNIESLIVQVKTDDIYKDIAKDVETRFDISSFRPLPKGKYTKVIGLMKGELGEQIMKEFIELRIKRYSCLKDNNDEDKKAKRAKKCVIKRKLNFQDYKDCLEVAQIERKIKYFVKKLR